MPGGVSWGRERKTEPRFNTGKSNRDLEFSGGSWRKYLFSFEMQGGGRLTSSLWSVVGRSFGGSMGKGDQRSRFRGGNFATLEHES